MSGYTGNPDAESEQALIMAENGVYASQQLLNGPVLQYCLECGDAINPARIANAIKMKMKCAYCITCQVQFDKPGRIKMLDRIL